MKQTNHTNPSGKGKSAILFVFMILLSIGMLIAISCSFYTDSVPEDLMQISCSFHTYEIQNHTKSTSYDLRLFSEDHPMPFELLFFDGYADQLSPQELCTGNTYSLQVAPSKSSYVIYSCSDSEGNLLMTKKEAYRNSQGVPIVILTVFFLANIAFWVIRLLFLYRPDLFGDRIKKLFLARRKSI
jgi:hypothetical protein